MPRPSITLYLDTVSPFSYIVYYILRVSLPSFLEPLPATLYRLITGF
jgi:hypothetical protein